VSPRIEASRRAFLLTLVGGAAAALLSPGCHPSPTEPSTPTPLSVPFGLWSQIRDAMRGSPDHLPAAAEAAVAAKDGARLAAIVRDQMVTMLPVGAFIDVQTWVRCGALAALRCGVATPREKADLLALLLVRAGYEATVVSGKLLDVSAAQAAILGQRVTPSFAPAVDAATVEEWRKAIGASGPASPPAPLDPDAKASQKLAATVLAALPPGLEASGAGILADLSTLPVVRIVKGGSTQYANPSLPGTSVGDAAAAGIKADPLEAGPAAAPMKVGVKLSMTTTAAPVTPVTLVERQWSADQVAGRQIRAQFRPAQDLAVVARAAIRDIHLFIPALCVTGPDLDVDAGAALSASADFAISTSGEQLVADSAGKVTVDGNPLVGASDAATDPALIASVTKLSVDVAAETFPDLRVRVGAQDAGGKLVGGLLADAFAVDDEGTKLSFLMAAAAISPPRVLIVFDLSGSIPDTFASVSARDMLAQGLASGILAAYPDAGFQAIAVSGGDLPTLDGYTIHDAAALSARLETINSFGSKIWTALRDANQAAPTVIILITDGGADETMIDSYRADVAAGAPVVAAAVGTINAVTMDDIVALSGGVLVTPTSPDDIAVAATKFLGRRQGQPYLLRATAPESGPAKRTLTVRLPGGVEGSAIYTVPDAAARATPPAVASLRLTVTIGDEAPITRVIAGHRGDKALAEGEVVPAALLAEVRGALLGGALLSVEAGPTPLSVWMDDLITRRLLLKPIHDAAVKGDSAAILDVLAGGVPHVPQLLPLLHPPLDSAGQGVTYEGGLRVVLYTERPMLNGPRHRVIDILPSTRFTTVDPDHVAAFATTLTRSARLAIAEARALPKSTLSLLADRPLISIAAGSVNEGDLAMLPADVRAAWVTFLNADPDFRRVLPAAGDVLAYWAIHPSTGSMRGIVADRSGGSFADDVNCQVTDAQSLISLIALMGGLAGFGALGVWAIFAKLEAAAMIRAAAAIEKMDATGTDDQFDAALATTACDLLKAALFEGFPILEALALVDAILDVLGRSFPCGFNAPETGPLLC
jgi:hypothetical protein